VALSNFVHGLLELLEGADDGMDGAASSSQATSSAAVQQACARGLPHQSLAELTPRTVRRHQPPGEGARTSFYPRQCAPTPACSRWRGCLITAPPACTR
jgi:hypothetical protein